MKKTILSSLTALIAMVSSAFAAPEPGLYSGTVTITRILGEEGLASRYSLRVQARVKEDGSLTILTTAPELPKTATVEDAITRAEPIPRLTPQPDQNPAVVVSPAIFPPPRFGPNYMVDGKFPAILDVKGKIVTLRYQNPALPVIPPEVIIQDVEKPIRFAPPAVQFLFTLRKSGRL